jgi:hypothetical protein
MSAHITVADLRRVHLSYNLAEIAARSASIKAVPPALH